MCGISGFFNPSGFLENSIDKIISMTELLHHRGPDDTGYFVDSNVALGHKRLSIIDIEGGKQPMSDSEEEIFIIYNGEIYNFQEIKEELKKIGYKFRTNSDTEVIIYAYKHWDEEFIEKLNGMFAFCIYDKRKNSVYLYRDRIGLKPLYYTFLNDTLIFSSEPKSIFKYSDSIKLKLNIKALSNYLTSHNFHFKDETLFENIKIIEPGYFLKYSKKGVGIKKYWDVNIENNNNLNFEDLKHELKNNLNISTLKRLISDVPLGAYLSGGVDSTVLISIIKDRFRENLKTFTIGFENDEFNEFNFSEIVNKIYKTDNEKVIFSEDNYFEILEDYLKIKDFPLNVPNEILIYYLSKYLKKDITVVLSGEGSDEILGGYGIFLRSVHDYTKIFILKNCPDFFSDEIKNFQIEKLNKLYKNINFSSIYEFLYNTYSVFTFKEKSFLLNKEILNELDRDNFIIDEFKKIIDKNENANLYDRFSYFLLKFHLPGLLLRLDNATMAASVEARAPFTDYKFVEFSFKIPFKYKIKWKDEKYQMDAVIENAQTISEHFDITKYILKESFKNEIPDEIYKRHKWSFPVPLNEFFNEKFKDYSNDIFKKKSIFYEFFNYKNVNNFVNEVHYGNKGLKTWMLLNLKLWMENYL